MRGAWVLALAGLLGGCVGEPRIYLRPQPTAARPRPAQPPRAAVPAAQAAERPSQPAERAARPSTRLSEAEKQRLFRQFEESRASGTEP